VTASMVQVRMGDASAIQCRDKAAEAEEGRMEPEYSVVGCAF
jgi:hypothetical protein